jgi:hypothetical protein
VEEESHRTIWLVFFFFFWQDLSHREHGNTRNISECHKKEEEEEEEEGNFYFFSSCERFD